MNWPLFFSTFSLIFVAELPDKTAMATLLMAAKGRAVPVFTGVALAFLVQSLIGVCFGGLIGLLPPSWVHLGAGCLFIGFGAFLWIQKEEEGGEGPRSNPAFGFARAAWGAFLVVFVAEWGDLTQLSTASMAARYPSHLITVFLASILALWSVTAIAVWVGRHVGHRVDTHLLRQGSALLFALVGIYFLLTWIQT